MLKTLLLIGSGGFLGTVSRYLLSRYISLQWPHAFPFGTFTVNILGCLLIGIVMGLTFQSALSPQNRLVLATGFCGGFTTFSTFSLEMFEIYQKGQWAVSFAYMAASVIFGLIALWLGFWIVKSLK